MDQLSAAAEASKLIAGDYVMSGILLLIWGVSCWYLVKVIKAIISQNKSQINEIIKDHKDEVVTLTNQIRVMNENQQESNKELIQVLKENQEYIQLNTGAFYRLEALIKSMEK